MKKILIAGTLALALGGCSTLKIGSAVTFNTLEGVVSAYGVALNAENVYKSLPLCKTGTTPALTNVCAKRSIIVRLQAADRTANAAVNQAVAFVKANPTVDPSQYISAAQQALAGLQAVLSTATVPTH